MPQFAKGLVLSLKGMNVLYTTLLVTTIVIGIQAVGVILIAALLIIPSVSARYWTHSFKWMIIISALFGGSAGAIGTIISAAGQWLANRTVYCHCGCKSFLLYLYFSGKKKGL